MPDAGTRAPGAARFRLGCDVGGTFTDFVLLNQDTGEYDVHKVLTTHDDPSTCIAAGAAELDHLRRGVAAETGYIIHGTTLVINAILKRHGAPTAIVTTQGFADILAIRREIRYDIYDLDADYPEPLIPKANRREVNERATANGTIVTPMDEAEVEDLLAELVAGGIQSVAVCFINSYVNPVHEDCVARIAAARFPQLQVSLSSRVLREVREFERTSTTAINAYVRPLIGPYIDRLERRLAEQGYAGRVYMMLSGGGIVAPPVAMEFPVRIVESGPVGGALAAAHLSRRAGLGDLIVFDMGGTTAKTTLLRHGHLTITTEYEVDRVHRFKKGSGTPIAIPCVDLIEIGTGGGSIAAVNRLGLLQVGPQSAESDPGPVCYGRGGEHPTVTDAKLLLGYLDPRRFLGGRMTLDVQRARASIASLLGAALGLPPSEAAFAVHDVANESMASSIRMFMAEKGMDASQAVMLAFGGGGPLHAHEIARKLGATSVIVPRAAGVFAALGFLVAPVAYQVSRSRVVELGAVALSELDTIFRELEQEAGVQVSHAVSDAPVEFLRELDVCYAGQGSTVRVNADGLKDPNNIGTRFSRNYRALYGFSYEDLPVQIITMRVTASSAQELPEIGLPFPEGPLPTVPRRRAAYSPVRREFVDYAVYDLADLTADAVIDGPALVEDPSYTLAAHEGARLHVDRRGWLRMDIQGRAA